MIDSQVVIKFPNGFEALYPNLMINGITKLTPQGIETWSKLSADNPIFSGHFPSNPVTPGIFQVEILCQSAMAFLQLTGDNQFLGPKLLTVNKVKFKKMVKPTIHLHNYVEIIETDAHVTRFKGTSSDGDDVVCSAAFSMGYEINARPS